MRGGQKAAAFDIIDESNLKKKNNGNSFRFTERQSAGVDLRALQARGF